MKEIERNLLKLILLDMKNTVNKFLSFHQIACGLSLLLVGLLYLVSGCVNPPDFADVPKIELIGLSKDSLLQGVFQEDSVVVVFSFEDGDGDIGRTEQSPANNVFFTDTRSGLVDNTFGIPFIPPQGSSNGIEGEVRILLFSTCCVPPQGQGFPCESSPLFPFDEVSYDIQIMDRAGNMSNVINTGPITLICN